MLYKHACDVGKPLVNVYFPTFRLYFLSLIEKIIIHNNVYSLAIRYMPLSDTALKHHMQGSLNRHNSMGRCYYNPLVYR